jgi:hypothetical protein
MAKNTTIAYAAESFTLSKPKNILHWLVNTKRRHVATAQYYKLDQLQLGTFYCSIAILLLPIVLLAFQFQWILVLSLIALRYSGGLW